MDFCVGFPNILWGLQIFLLAGESMEEFRLELGNRFLVLDKN